MKNINWRIYVGGLTTLAFSSLICDYEGWDLVGEFSRRWGEMSLNGDGQMIRPCQLELKVRLVEWSVVGFLGAFTLVSFSGSKHRPACPYATAWSLPRTQAYRAIHVGRVICSFCALLFQNFFSC